MCVGWWISPVKKWLYAKRVSARTFTSAYHFHNESQTIKTEFARRAVITSVNSLPLFCWSFWIAASPLRRWESSHTLLLVIRMSLILVGASHTFLLVVSLDTESEMMRWDGDIGLKHGTRSNSEMISYWVYWNWNTIFIMKRNDWSTERMMDVNESWRTVTHFFAGYLANERIKDWYKMPSAVPQQCRHGLSSCKRWFLL